jgi:hypothetical protein
MIAHFLGGPRLTIELEYSCFLVVKSNSLQQFNSQIHSPFQYHFSSYKTYCACIKIDIKFDMRLIALSSIDLYKEEE